MIPPCIQAAAGNLDKGGSCQGKKRSTTTPRTSRTQTTQHNGPDSFLLIFQHRVLIAQRLTIRNRTTISTIYTDPPAPFSFGFEQGGQGSIGPERGVPPNLSFDLDLSPNPENQPYYILLAPSGHLLLSQSHHRRRPSRSNSRTRNSRAFLRQRRRRPTPPPPHLKRPGWCPTAWTGRSFLLATGAGAYLHRGVGAGSGFRGRRFGADLPDLRRGTILPLQRPCEWAKVPVTLFLTLVLL